MIGIVRVEIGTRAKWVLANSEAQGYYRVLYSRKIYKELTKQLKDDPSVWI